MAYYSDELIEEVRSRNDIVDVISGYVRLTKKGSTYFGLCPFHNEKTGSYIPVAYTQMVTNVKVDRSTWMMVAQVISGLLAVFAIIASTVLFIQLIVAINKSDIFNWKNVRRLRWLGVALLLNFLSEAVPALMNDYELSSVFSLSGYSMETSIDSVMLVILGLVSLIVGEVFAIGLKMKEEQDLTI